ncbi:hypothetical protein RIVM261_039720 [Rivularia sp. IAM M-261]|nr:hypothetical protein CAL7716_078900 [Calothrix sp. PCC 7716]GJD19016.1 hypothetical protein RIVM261_039720 [Rivularia sp. IAM M-261]
MKSAVLCHESRTLTQFSRYPKDIPKGRVASQYTSQNLQHDGTEEGIANRLVEMEVPKQDIILAFHEPYIRQFTEFGTS